MSISLDHHALGKTAQFVAACRAVESDKPAATRKFSEPWAREFATETGMHLARSIAEEASMSFQDLANIFTARTCFLDDVVNRAISRENSTIRQVVIAAVGGDGRPYRLRFPDDVVVFEMDLPDVMKFRSKVFAEANVQPTCDLRGIQVDLSKDGWVEALVAAGFKSSEPSVWVMEGLLMYLTREDCEELISQVTALSTPGSVLCGSVASHSYLHSPSIASFRRVWADLGAAPLCSFIDDPKAYFERFGYQTIAKRYEELAIEFEVGYSSAGPFSRPQQENNKNFEKETDPPLTLYFEAIQTYEADCQERKKKRNGVPTTKEK